MSDDVKDFAYYAAKAEEALQTSLWAEDEPGQRDRYIHRAEVYARLACGSHTAKLAGVCPGRLFPVPPNGDFRICVLGIGHSGDHATGDGVYFHD